MRANLLLYYDAFKLEDYNNFCEKISLLVKTILEAKRRNEDKILLDDNINFLQISGIELYKFASERLEDNFEQKKQALPCYHHDFIGNLIYLLSMQQTEYSQTLAEMNEIEFPGENNGLIGIDFTTLQIDDNYCVYNIHSWFNLHFHFFIKNPNDRSFFENQKQIQGNQYNTYFPNLEYSNELAKNDWSLFYKSHKTDNEKKHFREIFGADDRIALIKIIAHKVANRNFYNYNEELSNYNDLHNHNSKTTPYQIFEAGYGRDRIYLSTDFETGAFEICDYRGNHKGEYFFNGNLNPNSKDTSGGHDIVLHE